MFEKMFKLKENNTTVKTEVVAGLTTFMTMAYILKYHQAYHDSSRHHFRPVKQDLRQCTDESSYPECIDIVHFLSSFNNVPAQFHVQFPEHLLPHCN